MGIAPLTLITSTVLIAYSTFAADSDLVTEVEHLKEARAQAVEQEVKRIDTAYNQKLQLLLMRANRANDAAAIQLIQSLLPPLASNAVAAAAAPATKRSLTKPEPRSYVSKTQGRAGFNNVNNKYAFMVESIGTKATVHYWGAGGSGNDTFGKVCLIHPSGREVVIGAWAPDDLPKNANDVAFWKRLPEKTIDVTEHMTEPGEYTIAFRYTGGHVGFEILRVELVIE